VGNICKLDQGEEMKRTNNVILLSIFLCSAFLILPAKTFADISPDLFGLRNPFKSWLPKVEEIIEKLPEPTKIEVVEPPKPITQKPEPTQHEKIVAPVMTPPKLVVNGLIWGTDKPQAIINDRVVSVGDTIENSKIIDINQNGVDIIFSNSLFTIQIEQAITQAI